MDKNKINEKMKELEKIIKYNFRNIKHLCSAMYAQKN